MNVGKQFINITVLVLIIYFIPTAYSSRRRNRIRKNDRLGEIEESSFDERKVRHYTANDFDDDDIDDEEFLGPDELMNLSTKDQVSYSSFRKRSPHTLSQHFR